MSAVGRLWRWIVRMFCSWRFDRDLEEELRQHLEWRTEEAMDAGLDPASARRAAALKVGGALRIRESCRDVWGLTWLRDLAQDLRHALRLFGRNPGFCAVAILSLALGIGGNAAVFSLLDAVVYRPLPVPAPGELVLFAESPSIGFFHGTERGARSIFAYREYQSLRDSQQALRGVLAVSEAPGECSIRVDDGANPVEQAVGTLVSGNYFEVLGVTARVGRTLRVGDDGTPGTQPVAVISDAYWSRRFSRDPDVLGRSIRVGRAALVVVGVAASGFTGDHVGVRTDFWVPLAMQGEVMPHRAWRDDPRALWLRLIGRLALGQTMSQAEASLNVTLRQILAAEAGALPTEETRGRLLDQRIALTSAATGVSAVRERFSASLEILMGMVALVLLVACTNLATLLLARATARQKEMGMRLALGAGRSRVLRQTLAESALLSALGALAGLVVARVSGQILLRMASGGPQPIPLALPVDARVLGFTAGVAVLTTFIVGLVPALKVSHLDPIAAIRNAPGRDRHRRLRLPGRQALVVAQVALTLVLLVGAGLFVATVRNLARADLGFNRSVLQVGVDPIAAGYEGHRLADLGRRLIARLTSIGGVASVSLSDNGLLAGSDSMHRITVLGDRSRADDERVAYFDMVAPDHFRTLSIPVVAGRVFTARDDRGAPAVAVISQAMARYYFGDRTAVGRQFVADAADGPPTAVTVVGVVKDVRERGLRRDIVRRYYRPYFQSMSGAPNLRLLVRPSVPLAVVGPAVRAAIREIDPSLEIYSMATLDERLARQHVRDRLMARIATVFGLLAAFLAANGLYGVLAYAVTSRTREFGVRMALGAHRGTIVHLVLRDGGLMVLAGAGVGLPAAMLAARAASSQLFGVAPLDPVVLGTAVAVLLSVAGLAAYLPARHAARVEPLVALRLE